MGAFNVIKNMFNNIFTPTKRLNSGNDLDSNSKASQIAIIDTSNLNINRDLTDEETQSVERFGKEIDLSIDSIITYGDETAKEVSNYMEITRRRLNENIESNREVAKYYTHENIVRKKLNIEFNNAEIANILNELQKLKRECELRIIALEKRGQEELKKGKKFVLFLQSRVDTTKILSINNAIERLKTTIKIIDTLTHSINNELVAISQEEYLVDKYIENYDNERNIEVANKILDGKFWELKRTLQAIQEFEKNSKDFPTTIFELKFKDKELAEKIEIISQFKRYIDLYVEKNKKEFDKPGGIFDKACKTLDYLWESVESEYLDRELWAKRKLGDREIENHLFSMGIDKKLESIEKIILIFKDKIPEDFIRKFYKVQYYLNALGFEMFITEDVPHYYNSFNVFNEEKKKYYLDLTHEIIEKIHRESNDPDVLAFMDKHLKYGNAKSFLYEIEKYDALLRIEKMGVEGLFTLKCFDYKELMTLRDKNYSDHSMDGFQLRFGALTINFKHHIGPYSSYISLEELEQIDGLDGVNLKYKIFSFNGAQSSLAQDIFKIWVKRKKESNLLQLTQQLKPDQIPDILCVPDFFDKATVISNSDSNKRLPTIFAHNLVREEENDLGDDSEEHKSNLEFLADTEQAINKRIRLEKDKPEEDKSWNQNYVMIKEANGNVTLKVKLADIICKYAKDIEALSNNKISRESIRDKILSFDRFIMSNKNQDFANRDENGSLHISVFVQTSYGQDVQSPDILLNIYKELTRGLLYRNSDTRIEIGTNYSFKDTKDTEEEKLSDFFANYIKGDLIGKDISEEEIKNNLNKLIESLKESLSIKRDEDKEFEM